MMMRTKLVIGFLSIALLVSFLSTLTIIGIHDAQMHVNTLETDTLTELDYAHAMSGQFHMAALNTMMYLLTDDDVHLDHQSTHLQRMDELVQQHANLSGEHLHQNISDFNDQAAQQLNTAVQQYDRGEQTEAINTLEATVEADSEIMTFYHRYLPAHLEDEREESATAIHSSFNTAQTLTLSISFLSLLLAAAIGLGISRSFAKPLHKLQLVINNISKGNMSTQIPQELKVRRDELGDLARAFDRTLISLKLAMRKTAPELEEKVKEKEAALKYHVKTLESALNTLNEGVLITDTDKNVLHYNKTFLNMWNLSEDDLSSSERSMTAVMEQLENPDEFAELIQDMYDHPEKTVEDTVEFADGRRVKRLSKPVWDDEEIVGRLFRFHDLSEKQDSQTGSV